MQEFILKAKNIKWDTDEDMNLLKELPSEIEIPFWVIEEVISDYISDETGFCHGGFVLVAESIKNQKLKQAKRLWKDFGNVPMNPETECIEEEWNGFPTGTHREEIWYWFEKTFNLSVAEDLMGL